MLLKTRIWVSDKNDPMRKWKPGTVLEVNDPERAAALISKNWAYEVTGVEAKAVLDPKPPKPRKKETREESGKE